MAILIQVYIIHKYILSTLHFYSTHFILSVLVFFVPQDTGISKHFLNKTLVVLEIAPEIHK